MFASILIVISNVDAQEVKVYFSKNVDTTLHIGIPPDGWNVRLDSLLAEFIDSAEYSVDICVYNMDNTSLTFLAPAIRQAIDREIKFRVITDDGFDDEEVLDSLGSWGILQIDDGFGSGSSYYMHCKFFIIDGRDDDTTNDISIISSSNLTIQNLERDANNTVVIHWYRVSQALEKQFDVYWGSSGDIPNEDSANFRDNYPDIIQHIFERDDIICELYFSPQKEQYEDSIFKRINSINDEVYFCINRFTRGDENMDDSLKSLYYHGIDLHGVFGVRDNVYKDMLGENTDRDTIYNWNPTCEYRVFTDTISSGVIHSKYLIGDSRHPLSNPFVLTGSMNWSAPGFHSNNECVLIIHNYEVAQKYLAAFATQYIGSLAQITESFEPPMKLRIYPNPTQNYINIVPQIDFELYDIRGRKIGDFSPPIYLGGMPVGIYLIKNKNEWHKILLLR
ncbi:hypothetical protein J7L68_01180 [bacterium]|nr:hypothetical protein [bacterium]